MNDTHKGKRTWAADAGAVVLLVLLTVVFYREIALAGKVLPGVDAMTYFYPYRHYTAQMVCRGHIPLWNPYLFMGVPLLANPQTAVLYPLNAALCFLDGPRLVTWSVVLHVALAAGFTYLYARGSLKLSVLPALLAAGAFAWGGFLSGMVEHVNQLNVLAWFPLLLWLWDQRARHRWPAMVGAGVVIALGLLAGHTQSTYISLFGLAVYALSTCRASRSERLAELGRMALDLAVCGVTGAVLAAVQLLPTWELTRLSIRGGGLSYREAVAFSLKPLPRLLRYAFLPPLGANLGDQFGGDFFTEFVAYIGIVPLVLVVWWLGGWVVGWLGGWVVGWLGGWENRQSAIGNRKSKIENLKSKIENLKSKIKNPKPATGILVLSGLGIFLALGGYNPLYWVFYKLVPGFGLFRVPARWLFLYAFGAATLAGLALEQITNNKSPCATRHTPNVTRYIQPVILIVAWIELFVAAQAMPLAHPTAPQAFFSMRTAPAHIIAAQSLETMPGRVLSMSDILFDPGDQREMEQIFAGQLEPRAIYDLIVGAKRKEVLTPNMPLAWRVYSVDGYDGGILPLQRYVELQKLFLPPERRSPDGRLRENLKRIPPSRLLSLLGVHYVLTDKVNDVWIDNVFYDLAFEARLSQDGTPEIETTDLPDFQATALGIVAYVEGVTEENAQVAEIHIESADGERILLLYRQHVGQDASTRRATVVEWDNPQSLRRLRVVARTGTLHIQGLTLIDRRDGSNIPVILSTDGAYRLVHSGDVKIYRVLDALPRAFVVGEAMGAETDEQALDILADPTFDPARQVVLSGHLQEPNSSGPVHAQVVVQRYEPERVELHVTLDAPGYLVLGDADYPGWQATVDGIPTPIRRANLLFRAVYLDAGTHTVEFVYRPITFKVGAMVSLAGAIMVILPGIVRVVTRATHKKAPAGQQSGG